MEHRILAGVLAVLLSTALLPVSAHAAAFSDTSNHWASKEIDKWSGHRKILGYYNGTFRPDDPITRGDMVVILDRVMNFADNTNNLSDNGPFIDIPPLPHYPHYLRPIYRAYGAGIFLGDNGKARPEDYITREEAATLLGRAFGLEESNTPSGFDDAENISPWARGFVNAMAEEGFIEGYQNRFNPKANITRAEAVKLFDNSVVYESDFYYVPVPKEMNGIVVVNSGGVHLKDVTINGNLIFSQGSTSIGYLEMTNVTVNGNLILRVNDRIDVFGTSHFENVIFEKNAPMLERAQTTSLHIRDEESTTIGKIYSKAKVVFIYPNKYPIEYAPGVLD